MAKSKKNEALQTSNRILIGMAVGVLLGILYQFLGASLVFDFLINEIAQPLGSVFLRALFLLIVPLVFASLASGVAQLGSGEHVARLGWRIGAFYVGTSLIAVFIGQSLVSIFKPGAGVDPDLVRQAQEGAQAQMEGFMAKSDLVGSSIWPGVLYKIVPTNVVETLAEANMLGIIFIGIIFGIALTAIEKKKSDAIIKVLEGVTDITLLIVGWIMRNIAPYAIGALMMSAISNFGIEIMGKVTKYMGVVLLGCAIQFGIVYPAFLKILVRIPWREFLKRGFPAMSTAFSTASSSATMPTTIYTLEKRFGVPESVTTFSIPIGTTINMDGTALFSSVAAVFVAQIYGIDLGLSGQMALAMIVLFASIGVAGVPGGLYPILISAMVSLGIPPEGMALILGVDRLLDMCRTAVNVTGDMTGTLFLARVENVSLEKKFKEIKV